MTPSDLQKSNAEKLIYSLFIKQTAHYLSFTILFNEVEIEVA